MEDTKEYWESYHFVNDVDKAKQTKERLDFATNLLKENNIEYKVCNEQIGHINFLYNKKVIISFWTRTGKFYCPRTKESDNVGIRNAIKIFKREVKKEIKKEIEILNKILVMVQNDMNSFIKDKENSSYAFDCYYMGYIDGHIASDKSLIRRIDLLKEQIKCVENVNIG